MRIKGIVKEDPKDIYEKVDIKQMIKNTKKNREKLADILMDKMTQEEMTQFVRQNIATAFWMLGNAKFQEACQDVGLTQ